MPYAMKIVNNVALAGAFQAAAEALELGNALGLDFHKMLDALSNGPAATPMFSAAVLSSHAKTGTPPVATGDDP